MKLAQPDQGDRSEQSLVDAFTVMHCLCATWARVAGVSLPKGRG